MNLIKRYLVLLLAFLLVSCATTKETDNSHNQEAHVESRHAEKKHSSGAATGAKVGAATGATAGAVAGGGYGAALGAMTGATFATLCTIGTLGMGAPACVGGAVALGTAIGGASGVMVGGAGGALVGGAGGATVGLVAEKTNTEGDNKVDLDENNK